MIDERKKPPIFNVDEVYQIKQSTGMALFGICSISIVIYFALKTDNFELPTTPWPSWIPQFLCIASACIIIPALSFFVGIKGFVDGFSIRNKKKEWMKNATSVQVSIIDTKAEYNDYAETRDEVWDYKLALRLPPVIKKELDEQIVWVRVSGSIYDKYKVQDAARIYYSATEPCEFIIDGE